MNASFDGLLKRVTGKVKRTIAVAMAEDEDVLQGVALAFERGIADAVLVGDKQAILAVAREHAIDLSHFDIVQANGEQESVAIAVQLVRQQMANALMKGKCTTATLLKGVLDKQAGLRSGKLLSHLAAFEVPAYHKLLLMSDAAMNIAPDLAAKTAITENALAAARLLEIEKPKVAIIAAVEKVNFESMPCTVDAAALSQMAARGQFGAAIVDGPLAVDNAVSSRACEVKGIRSPVGGEADILIMPDIEAANVFYKTLTYLGGSRTAGIIVGAQSPIILTSRADSEESKFLSIVLAMATSVRL
ncbi:MAG TPA: bifunctional enoyl-CoA hydratase/phosphate acetyltransferase [bacterium]|nr:bifunctional enoyl-CoA hydratase/phosphate acetyltransferase [bacterium]HQI49542.1 bifunctional enoyl-CoA hydratase/phosphate acetyltransferase [bacterium]HQJ64720.1 bifunctional enoyl-CoA hydratase/phosphate acetyltransferase [bacterium]